MVFGFSTFLLFASGDLFSDLFIFIVRDNVQLMGFQVRGPTLAAGARTSRQGKTGFSSRVSPGEAVESTSYFSTFLIVRSPLLLLHNLCVHSKNLK